MTEDGVSWLNLVRQRVGFPQHLVFTTDSVSHECCAVFRFLAGGNIQIQFFLLLWGQGLKNGGIGSSSLDYFFCALLILGVCLCA